MSNPDRTDSHPADAMSEAARPRALKVGTKVGGRYIIQQVLGQGGFGISYLALDAQRFDEPCVVKEFRPLNVRDRAKILEKAVSLFKREAKILYRIDHPQVPKFMASFTQAQRLFIIQEYIHGDTYLKLLRDRKKEGKTFTEAEVTAWLAHMLQVLGYLHDLGILHRDISPENVMQPHGRELPVLIDFGLVNDPGRAGYSQSTASSSDVPHSTTLVGKFGYSPPEQVQLGRCNPSTDLYALGVTALVLLTGKHPRDLIDPQTLDWQWHKFSRISAEFGPILTKMVQQRPQARFQSVGEVMQHLSPLLSPELGASFIKVPPPNPPKSIPTPVASMPSDRASGIVDSGFLDRCREELSRCIGPMASMVIEDALEENPQVSARELVSILASQISDVNVATAFLSHLQVPEDGVGESISEEFVDRCRQALARCIGPMAATILDETLADYPQLTSVALVEKLAAEIPSTQMAEEFRRQF